MRVLDVGAGAMTLESVLPPGSQYTPADVVARREGCLVVDLNRQQFPPGQYDVVSFLGVLEYIHDPRWPLRKAAEAAPSLIVSYCTDISGDLAYRRGLGWVNEFTALQFEALLGEAGAGRRNKRALQAERRQRTAALAVRAWLADGAWARTPWDSGDLSQKDFVVISPVLVDLRPRPRRSTSVTASSWIPPQAYRGKADTRDLLAPADQRRRPGGDQRPLVLLLVARLNTLKSSFEITPNFTPGLLDRISVPVAMCGIHYQR